MSPSAQPRPHDCDHPLDSHGSGGWCLFPDCECGKKQTLTFNFSLVRDGISWLVLTHCEELDADFQFTVAGEVEDEAIWNAFRALRTARLR